MDFSFGEQFLIKNSFGKRKWELLRNYVLGNFVCLSLKERNRLLRISWPKTLLVYDLQNLNSTFCSNGKQLSDKRLDLRTPTESCSVTTFLWKYSHKIQPRWGEIYNICITPEKNVKSVTLPLLRGKYSIIPSRTNVMTSCRSALSDETSLLRSPYLNFKVYGHAGLQSRWLVPG